MQQTGLKKLNRILTRTGVTVTSTMILVQTSEEKEEPKKKKHKVKFPLKLCQKSGNLRMYIITR